MAETLDMQQIIQDMVDILVREFDPLKVILFGSHARGDAGPDSDVDLLVVLPEVASHHQTCVAMRVALAHAPTAKDVIVATPAELERWGQRLGSVYRSALREGVAVYARA
jgi:uncharacterized protein